MVEIEVGFDGSCPQSLDGVRRDGENAFTVFPSWRPSPGITEDGIGRTTRLGFRVRNTASTPVAGTFRIDWQYDDAPPDAQRYSAIATCELYMAHRDFCVVGRPGEEQWQYALGTVAGSTATFELTLEPDLTEVHWHPPYSYERGDAFVASLRERPWTQVEHLGCSGEGRDLWLIRIRDGRKGAKKPFLIAARMHAYESGGSYMMEGMVDYLLGESPWAAAARRDWEFHIVPMVNPDGVANGLGKLTTPCGTDVQWALPVSDDPTYVTFMRAVERVAPTYMVDLHNWQARDIDGAVGMDAEHWQRLQDFLPPIRAFGKRWWWRGPSATSVLPDGRQTVRDYCHEHFGTLGVAFECGWFGRQPADVRALGANLLRGVLLVEEQWNSTYR